MESEPKVRMFPPGRALLGWMDGGMSGHISMQCHEVVLVCVCQHSHMHLLCACCVSVLVRVHSLLPALDCAHWHLSLSTYTQLVSELQIILLTFVFALALPEEPNGQLITITYCVRRKKKWKSVRLISHVTMSHNHRPKQKCQQNKIKMAEWSGSPCYNLPVKYP